MDASDGTASPAVIDPRAPLGACESWSVMFSLPPRGEAALRALRGYRVGDAPGRFASTRAIVSALILHMPESSEAVIGLSNFSPAAGPDPPPGSTVDMLRRRTTVRLPAPLTLRLNRLIELASVETGQRCSRTAVLVSLMRNARNDDKAVWRARFTSVLGEPAGRAVPKSDQATSYTVLQLVRPSPGPRPQAQPASEPRASVREA